MSLLFPSNPVRAMADGKMLQIIVFALLFGYALSHAGEQGRRIASFFRDMEAVVMKMVEILMALAPYGPLGQPTNPRSYGTFPRVLGRYVRDWGALSLEEAVQKMSSIPATATRSP